LTKVYQIVAIKLDFYHLGLLCELIDRSFCFNYCLRTVLWAWDIRHMNPSLSKIWFQWTNWNYFLTSSDICWIVENDAYKKQIISCDKWLFFFGIMGCTYYNKLLCICATFIIFFSLSFFPSFPSPLLSFNYSTSKLNLFTEPFFPLFILIFSLFICTRRLFHFVFHSLYFFLFNPYFHPLLIWGLILTFYSK